MESSLKKLLIDIKKKHGDQYTIDITTFKAIKKEVIACCKDHGKYIVPAYNIRRSKSGACPKCKNKHRGAPSLNKKTFLEKYGNPQFEHISPYITMHEDILIRCKICNKNFLEAPNNHIKRYTCPHCIGIYNKIYGSKLDYFKEKVKLIHGVRYKYDFKTFKSFSDPLKIICNIHGEFYQTPTNHLRGNNCPECAYITRLQATRMSNEDFLKRANRLHNSFFIYKNKYINSNTVLEIKCPIHGLFYQKAKDHLSGKGCRQCFEYKLKNTLTLSNEEFIDKANEVHGQYLYTNAYQGSKIKLEIICPTHGPFEQRPNDHLMGSGCPQCARETTKAVEEICQILKENNIDFIVNDRSVLERKELDIYIPDKNLAIEFNGLYFHREGLVDDLPYGKNKHYHLDKTEECLKQNIRLFHIFDDEWNKNKELILVKIKHALGINNSPTIGARKCKIKEVDNKISSTFLEKYHIQGGDIAKHRLGAYYKDELVGILTIVKMRGEYKLNRFATNTKYRLPGLASKMFKKALDLYEINKITTFSDKRYGIIPEKAVYLKLGFKYVKETEPAYWYYEMKTGKRYNRKKFMKHKILINYPQYLNRNMTEKEIMIDLGYDRIWDCGHYKFIYEKQS